MAASNNVEFEAAKFLQKLIQESRDEPAKLATKLYVILQHMKSSGKEHSMPYQVISRAMETVISQHNLDIEALKSSRLPVGGSHAGESATSVNSGSSQLETPPGNSKAVITGSEQSMGESFDPSRQSIGPSSGHNYYQASMSQRTSFWHEPESPSAVDPRSPELQNQERLDQSNLGRTTNRRREKRKRGESLLGMETHAEISQNVDSVSSFAQPRIAKVNKVQQSGSSIGAAVGSNQEDQTQSGIYMSENPAFAPKVHHERNMENYPLSSSFQVDHTVNNVPSQFTPPGGTSNVPEAMKNNVQDTGQSLLETNMAGDSSLGENGKSIAASGKLFNEQQLKQLRAQCLVFLAFRNCVPPKPLHVEIALGISHPEEGSSLDVNYPLVGGYREDTQSSNDPRTVSDPAIPSGRLSNVSGSYVYSTSIGQPTTQLMTKEASLPSLMANGNYRSTELPLQEESRPLLSTKGLEADNIEKEKRAFDHELHPPIATEDVQIMPVNTSLVVEDQDGRSASLLHQPKHTMLEKWIMQVQNKKLQDEQNWLKKQKKAELRIFSSFERLKENVSSSEDLAAKTKNVIELKKLQLLALQQRLRSDFLSEFFKPVVTEMDHLQSFKKHKHIRRIKQIEKYEQRVKEERQKRIRDRQKEFFGDIEVHKEKLDDVFKIKRERLKGFNKFVKEFHKRKERIHREKIDRIHREKITLLKINDVEGYLRMVQDAKSDRVKQLLKETEKYLQKLGSKLREAKAMANFVHDGDEIQTSALIDNSESAIENDDECDQAKHYKESNEKYYMMAHSIKEEIAEQPTTLLGGKLREYQMNGLRWLVSLYNNHLNGILADEMGLGKTVQVISLICYLMEAKNDRGPFLVVVPSSVLPGWETEINFWAPAVHKIVYSGPPEERRRLFKERIVHRKFNVLLTTYEYLMNKHDRPKLSKVHWRYIIIDEGHRIKNASCKLNAELKHYQSSHRLLLTGTPLQNNLEELWALLNFLLPNIFNSSEDFSQWFNKPFRVNGDNSTDEALLSEEENLLVINRLHQVLRPFVLRRLKHKVENELPEKIERLIRCEASAYQKLLMKRVEQNLGSLGNLKARSVQNSVMELRNICNHPYLSQLHAEEVDNLIPKHFLPPIVRLCGKLEMLDRLLPKLKATDHRVLFFSTMTRLLDVMEEYLSSKQYRYLRLDGHTYGGDRGALIDLFNQPDSPFFIFLLSIRAGGVGVNLQAADTVIIFDTDWNPQVDLQAQARAHRIGQKKDVLVLRFETVRTVEEQVRAAAEHKLGVANQSITAGFFDNDTSAADRREYLESLLRESKKEEAAPVLDDDALNDILARSESEIDIFEYVDKQRREEELARWAKLVSGPGKDDPESLLPLPSRLVTENDLKAFYEAMKIHEEQRKVETPNASLKRKSGNKGSLNTDQYGRGKRAREVRSYEEQMTEEEFEKICQVESPRSPVLNAGARILPNFGTEDEGTEVVTEPLAMIPPESSSSDLPLSPTNNDLTPPSRRGRGRPKRAIANIPFTVTGLHVPSGVSEESHRGAPPSNQSSSGPENSHGGVNDPSAARFTSTSSQSFSTVSPQMTVGSPSAPQRRGRRQATLIGGVPHQLLDESGSSLNPAVVSSTPTFGRGRGRGRKSQASTQAHNGRGRRSSHVPQAIADVPVGQDLSPASTTDKSWSVAVNVVGPSGESQSTDESNTLSIPNTAFVTDVVPLNIPASMSTAMERSNICSSREQAHASGGGKIMHPEDDEGPPGFVSSSPYPSAPAPAPVTRQSRRSQGRVEAPQRRGRKSALSATSVPDVSLGDEPFQPSCEDASRNEQPAFSTMGPVHGQSKKADVRLVASMMKNMLSDNRLLKSKGTEHNQEEQSSAISHTSLDNVGDGKNDQSLISKLSPGGFKPSAATSGFDNEASSLQNETLSGTEMEGRRLMVPAMKVVLGLEGKHISGSLGMVAQQYENENLDDMPAFPPGFEKFEASEGQAIEDGTERVDVPKELLVTTEATDLVIEDQTPVTNKAQIPSSRAQPMDICMYLQKNTEPTSISIASKPAPGGVSETSETATDLEKNIDDGLPKDMNIDSFQMVTVGIEKFVNNSAQSTSGLEDFKKDRNLDEDQRKGPSDVGSDSKDLDIQGEVGIFSTGVLGSDVSVSEESSPLDKVKKAPEPPSDCVTDKNIVASSKLESSPIVLELWERELEAKSEVSLLVINESATSTNKSYGKNKEIAVENCLFSNSMLEEVGITRLGSIASPGEQSLPDESSNMAVDDKILPTTNAEAFSSESLQSHRNSQESGDILVEGHDLSYGLESLRSKPVSLEGRPALDYDPCSAVALTEVDQNNDERLPKDSSMVISEAVSISGEQPSSSAVIGDRLSDFQSEMHDTQMNDGQALCQVDEIVPEESYTRNEPLSVSPPERDLSFAVKLVDQAEKTNVCSDPPQSTGIPRNSSAANHLVSFILINGESSDAKAGAVDIEFGKLKEISQDCEVVRDNLLQERIEPASYAISEKHGVESHEDSVAIASAEEKIDSHKSVIEIAENTLAKVTSDLEIEAHDSIIADLVDVCLANSVVHEAATESLNHSLLPDKVSPEELGRSAPLSDLLMLEDELMDTNENMQTMQVVDEGRDTSEFYMPPSSLMIDKPEISGEEMEVIEVTGDVKYSSEDRETALHKDIKEDPSEVMDFIPENHLKGDSTSTETENGLAFVSVNPGEGSEPETSQGHSLQGDGINVENIVHADSHLIKPEVTVEIVHLPFEVLKELQRKEDAVNEGTESHETEDWVGRRSDATCVDDVVMKSPLAGNESSVLLLPWDVIREGQIVDDKVKGQTGVDVAVMGDGREQETNRIEYELMDSVSAGNESSDILPLVTLKDGRSEYGSVNKLTGHEMAMQEERVPESTHFDDSVMDRASDENESSDVLPLVAVKEGSEDTVNEPIKGDDDVIREEREPEATRIDDVMMDGASLENELSEMLPLGMIQEGQSEDDTVKEKTEGGETVMGEERELDTGHIDDVVVKCASEGNKSSEIWPSEVIKEGQSDADAVNEQANKQETITSGGSESYTNLIHDVAPDSSSAESKSFELLPWDAIMEIQTEINNLNVQTEVPETVMGDGLESDAIRIDNVALSTALSRNESMAILLCHVIKDGVSECDHVNEQSEGPEPAMSEGHTSDTSRTDHVPLDNALPENEALEVLPSYITGEVMEEGQIEDDPVNEQTRPERLMSKRRQYDAGRIEDVAIASALVESEISEVLSPLEVNVTTEGKGEDHPVDMQTGGHKSLVSKGYESDATSDDDLAIDHAVAGDESSEIPTVVPEEDVVSKVKEEDMPSSTIVLAQGAAGKVEPSSANDPKDDDT